MILTTIGVLLSLFGMAILILTLFEKIVLNYEGLIAAIIIIILGSVLLPYKWMIISLLFMIGLVWIIYIKNFFNTFKP
jgi:hypothetical protein